MGEKKRTKMTRISLQSDASLTLFANRRDDEAVEG